MSNILFIAEYSPENIKIGEKIGQMTNFDSSFALWENKVSEKSKNDFESIILNSNIHNFNIINARPNSDRFIGKIINFAIKQPYEPTDIFIRGTLSQIWPISIALESFLISTKLHIILDCFERPLEEFEKKVLEMADTIFSMGPNAIIEEHFHKTIEVFKTFNSINFMKIPDFMFCGIDRKNIKLSILSNEEFKNIHDISKNTEISYINVDFCPENELAINMLLAGYVHDMSGKREVGLLLKKMGKVLVNNFDKKEEGYGDNFMELEDESLEEFAEYIVEKMLKITSIKKGETIRGHEII
jgi:hypothetical protein